jgi:hypothetical protein
MKPSDLSDGARSIISMIKDQASSGAPSRMLNMRSLPKPTCSARVEGVVLRIAALIAAISCLGCHPSEPLYAPEETPVGCAFGDRTWAACEALRAAELLDEDGRVMKAHAVSCYAGLPVAEATWEVAGRSPLRAAVGLSADGPRAALRPVAIDPVVLEWPMEPPTPAVHAVRIKVATGCAVGTRTTKSFTVDVASIGPSACIGEARLAGGDPNWCVRPTSEEAVYRISEHDMFRTRQVRTVLLTIGALDARLSANGATAFTKNVQSVRDIVEPVWRMPSELDESCKDGALLVVEAKRNDRWKVVRRRCGSPISIRRIARLFWPS